MLLPAWSTSWPKPLTVRQLAPRRATRAEVTKIRIVSLFLVFMAILIGGLFFGRRQVPYNALVLARFDNLLTLLPLDRRVAPKRMKALWGETLLSYRQLAWRNPSLPTRIRSSSPWRVQMIVTCTLLSMIPAAIA